MRIKQFDIFHFFHFCFRYNIHKNLRLKIYKLHTVSICAYPRVWFILHDFVFIHMVSKFVWSLDASKESVNEKHNISWQHVQEDEKEDRIERKNKSGNVFNNCTFCQQVNQLDSGNISSNQRKYCSYWSVSRTMLLRICVKSSSMNGPLKNHLGCYLVKCGIIVGQVMTS